MGATKTVRMQNIELRRGKKLEQIIREGSEKGWSWEQIAADLGVTKQTLRFWIRDLGGKVAPRRSSIRFGEAEAEQELAAR